MTKTRNPLAGFWQGFWWTIRLVLMSVGAAWLTWMGLDMLRDVVTACYLR